MERLTKRLRKLEKALKPRIIKVCTVFAFLKDGQKSVNDGAGIKFEMLPGHAERNPHLTELEDVKALKQAAKDEEIILTILPVADATVSKEREQLYKQQLEGRLS